MDLGEASRDSFGRPGDVTGSQGLGGCVFWGTGEAPSWASGSDQAGNGKESWVGWSGAVGLGIQPPVCGEQRTEEQVEQHHMCAVKVSLHRAVQPKPPGREGAGGTVDEGRF